MSGIIAGSVVDWWAGDRAIDKSNEANERMMQMQLDYLRDAEDRGRADITSNYNQVLGDRVSGYENAMDFLSGAQRPILDAMQAGNVGAQEIIAGSMPQIQNALLGGPINYDFLQPRRLDFDLDAILSGRPSPRTVDPIDPNINQPPPTTGFPPNYPQDPIVNDQLIGDVMNNNYLQNQAGAASRLGTGGQSTSGRAGVSGGDYGINQFAPFSQQNQEDRFVNNFSGMDMGIGMENNQVYNRGMDNIDQVQPVFSKQIDDAVMNDLYSQGLNYNNIVNGTGELSNQLSGSLGPNMRGFDQYMNNNLITGTDDPMEFLAQQEAKQRQQQIADQTMRQNLVNMSLAGMLSGNAGRQDNYINPSLDPTTKTFNRS